ncbi:hypothetical protein K443DRAFT_300020 [Laccaria amethystina LaAM-08-1]|uniref:Unplaced genomic scaffold K443scaffold_2, whole genome shotgun sequence n=1 Tax=Laccaria amethystina LaAM-08-1 TaxID=1095629 RepID=A0A0C9XBX4_9AGAR|nr:hypothetical protein K443DRAFT_300020 [Laccaria amethystina LaAM-08-1]
MFRPMIRHAMSFAVHGFLECRIPIWRRHNLQAGTTSNLKVNTSNCLVLFTLRPGSQAQRIRARTSAFTREISKN